jgi:predicted alpha/beta superfamily hydrolase
MKTFILFLSTILFFSACKPSSKENQKVELPTSLVLEMESEYVDSMTYDLFVDLPPSYYNSDDTYPVVYLLDAYEIYGLMLQTYQQLLFMQEVPEMIIVGISYKIDGDFYTDGLREYLDMRARDYTPTKLSYEETVQKHGKRLAGYVRYSGGGMNFQSFLEKELIPHIESEYRTDPEQRALFGYSLGGTFTIFSMLSKPTLFQKYFVGDAFQSWDNYAVFDFDHSQELIGSNDTLDVYIAWCEMETSDDTDFPLMKYLNDLDNPHIRYRSEVLEGETHLSGIGLAYSRAFRRLFGLW